MIDFDDLDNWKPAPRGLDLSDLDSFKPKDKAKSKGWMPTRESAEAIGRGKGAGMEVEKSPEEQAREAELWGGTHEEWQDNKRKREAEKARMVAESERGAVGGRRANEFWRQTNALNERGLRRGEFDLATTGDAARGGSEEMTGGIIEAAGDALQPLAQAFRVGRGLVTGDMEGINDPNAISDAGRGIAETGRIRFADARLAMIERPNALMSVDGLKFVAQEALASGAPTALGLAAGVASPRIGLGAVGASAAGSKYSQSRAEGDSPLVSAGDAAFAALAEGVPEALPLGVLTGRLGKFAQGVGGDTLKRIYSNPVGRQALMAGAEGLSEVTTELANIGYERAVEGKNVSDDEAFNRITTAFAVGTAMGGGIGAAAEIAGQGSRANARYRSDIERMALEESLRAAIRPQSAAAREITNRIAPAGDPDIDSGAKLADDAFNTARASQPPQSFALPSITPRTIVGESEVAPRPIAEVNTSGMLSDPILRRPQDGATELDALLTGDDQGALASRLDSMFGDLPQFDPLRPMQVGAADIAQGGQSARESRQGRIAPVDIQPMQFQPITQPAQSQPPMAPAIQKLEPIDAVQNLDAMPEESEQQAPPAIRGLTTRERQAFASLENEINEATAVRGGTAIVDNDGKVTGRLKWETLAPGRDFWRSRPTQWTADKARSALRKAQAGEDLTAQEKNIVDYARKWSIEYAKEIEADEGGAISDAKMAEREAIRDDIESTLPQIQDQSPQQRSSVRSLGSDYTARLLSLKKDRRAWGLNPDQEQEYQDLLELDRETGKVGGRPIVGVRNKTAYVDAQDEGTLLPVQGFTDADNFKSLNDRLGHETGDDAIREIGTVLVQEFGEGNVFHRGGDEFLFQAQTPEELTQKIERAKGRLSTLRLTAVDKSGNVEEQFGIGLSYGYGATEAEADEALKRDKQARKDAGLRRDRADEDRRIANRRGVGAESAGEGVRSGQGDGELRSAEGGVSDRNANRADDDGTAGRTAEQGSAASGNVGTRQRGIGDDQDRGQPAEGAPRGAVESRTRTVATATAELSDRLGAKFTRKLVAQPWFNLVESIDQVPDEIRRSITDPDTVVGFVTEDGQVYIIAGNIDSNVTGVVLHEVGVHYGLPGILGDDFAATLRQFKRLRAKDPRVDEAYKRAEEVAERGKDGKLTANALALLDEEALAYYVEQNWGAKTPIVQRVVDAIKRLLNRLGVPLSKLDASPTLIRDVAVGAARSAAEKGGVNGRSETAYTRTKPERKRNLIVQHNISASKLIHAERVGGLAVPSLAITKADAPVDGFGEITLLGDESTATPSGDTKVFGADIYSPRYPEISLEFSPAVKKRGEEMLKEGMAATDSNYIEWSEINKAEDLERLAPVMWQFLQSKGINPPVVRTQVKPLPDALRAFADDTRHAFELSSDQSFVEAAWKAHYDVMLKAYDGDAKAAREEVDASRKRAEDRGHSQLVKSYANEVMQRQRDMRSDGKADKSATRVAMEDMIRAEGLQEELSSYASSMLEELSPKERIYQGMTNSGNRRYVDHTIDRVVSILKKDLRGGENFNYGAGNLRAKFTPQFKTIAAIRGAEDRLMTKEAFEKVKDEINQELLNVAAAIVPNGGWRATDTASAILEEGAKIGLDRAAKQYGITLSDDARKAASDFLAKLRTLPTAYFEAKVLRAMDIGEFKAAIVPDNIQPRAREILEKRGLSITEYNAGDEKSRADAIARVSQSNGLRFSRRPTITVDGVERSRVDSTGKEIHPTEEGVRNFWRWFSGSAIADEQGRPIPVYHGTASADIEEFLPSDGQGESRSMRLANTLRGRIKNNEPFGYMDFRSGSFFSPDPNYAGNYTGENGAVYPVYIRALNPVYKDQSTGKVLPVSKTPDALVLTDGGKINEIAIVDPAQVKSATGNDGTFSPTDKRIAYSRRVQRTPEQAAALAKAGMPEDSRNIAQRAKDYIAGQWGNLKALAASNVKQSVFDRFHRMSAIEQELGIPAERSAYISARLSAGLPSIMEGIMMYGAPKWEGGALAVDNSTVGLLDALAPVKDDVNGWLGWMVGRRAKALKARGRENLMTDDDINALLSLANGREAQFEEAALKYLRIKRAILNVAEQAGLIDPAGRAVWDSVEYIPFYRQDEAEGDTIGPGTRQGLAGQSSGIRALKGGKQMLADPLGNIVRNFTRLIDASVKNHAMLEAVNEYGEAFFEKVPMSGTFERVPLSQVKKVLLERGVPQNVIDQMPQGTLTGLTKLWAIKPPSDDDVVRVMRNGKAEYYRVPDKDLLASLTAFKVPAMHWALSPFKFFKKLLTVGVTSSPDFMARNFVRDSLSSWVIADDKFRVGWDSVKGIVTPLLDNTQQKEMMFAGGSFIGGQFYSVGSEEETANAIRRALRDKGLKSKDIEAFMGTIARSPLVLWDKWQKIGSYIENANRNAIYENAIKAGRSRKEAAYLARDLMDFSMHGNSAFVQFLSDVLPFFNARLQGLYKLYRQGGKRQLRKAMLIRAGTITAFSLALMAWNSLLFGDAYDELEEWDKDTYWHIAPGTKYHIRVPKPFELGVLFATIPERVARAITYQAPGGDKGDRPRQTLDSFLTQIGGTLAMNPIPQGAMPIVEQWANKSFFTGRPIENMGDEKLLPEARAEWYTSDTAKVISDVIGNSTNLSPKRIEHLWNGYTGTIGGYLLDTTDALVRQIQRAPERPELAWAEIPLFKAFYRGDMVPKSTRSLTDFYELKLKADQVSGTIKDFELAGRKDDAAELEAKYAWLLGKRVTSNRAKADFMHTNVQKMNKARDQLSDIRKQIEGIVAMPGFTDERKRKEIEALTISRNEIAREITRFLREAERQSR